MFRNVASKAGLVGFALVIGAAGLEACSSSDSGTPSNTGGTSPGAGTGGASSHAGTTSIGGTSPGAGTSGLAGTSSGAGTTGSAGSGGGSATGPFACAGIVANCDTWTTFPQSTTNSWGSGMYTGGITIFGTGLTRDPATTDSIHVTGMVTGYGFGFGLYFTTCSDLSKYTGISFKVKGKTDATSMLALQVLTNPDTPWQPRPMDMKGACTAMDPTMAYNVCQPPTKSSAITTTESTVSVLFTDLAAGMPTATADPKQIVGLQWALPWAGTTGVAYAADVTVSDVQLTGGTGVSCAMGAGGTGAGGAGGSGGAATGGGGAGGTAGSGGSGG